MACTDNSERPCAEHQATPGACANMEAMPHAPGHEAMTKASGRGAALARVGSKLAGPESDYRTMAVTMQPRQPHTLEPGKE
jgi:hypothetical protein